MQTTKSLLFSVWMLAIVALLAATNAFAQNTCLSKAIAKNGSEVPGAFTVTVVQRVENGRRFYTYNVAGPNANKLMVLVRQGLINEQYSSRRVDTNEAGIYLTPHGTAGGFPDNLAWQIVHHLDGVVWTNIAIQNQYEIGAKERFQPQDSKTTVLIGLANSFEHCGPIDGPTNVATPVIFSNPVLADVLTVQFGNGCIYDFFFDPFTNYLTNMAKNQFSPEVGTDGLTCQVISLASVAEDLFNGPGFVPPTRKGDLPIQFPPGGLCRGVLPDGTGFKYPC